MSLEPRLATVDGGHANRKRATPIRWAAAMASIPTDHLDRVWPDTGPADNRQVAAIRIPMLGAELENRLLSEELVEEGDRRLDVGRQLA